MRFPTAFNPHKMRFVFQILREYLLGSDNVLQKDKMGLSLIIIGQNKERKLADNSKFKMS